MSAAGDRGRGLGAAVLACVAGAGLTIFAATRTWTVTVTPRPGLPALRETTTGAAAQPWTVALALVALAGAGALLATRGVVRRALGGLLVLVGIAAAASAVTTGLPAYLWPAACVAGAAMVVWCGLSAARRGHTWPAMGSRYERGKAPTPAAGAGEGHAPRAAAGSSRPVTDGSHPDPRTDPRAAWDALDRGDDPTT